MGWTVTSTAAPEREPKERTDTPGATSEISLSPRLREDWRPPELQVAEPPPVESFEELQAIALRYLGRPYVYGGNGRPGFDCSGYTCRVFAEAGYAIPRVSRDQARSGRSVDLDALLPGDLLFFAEPGERISHVGIYLGDGLMAHASWSQGKVVVAPLMRGWFQRRLVEARRVLNEDQTVTAEGEVVAMAEVTELEEHQGDFALAAPLRVRSEQSFEKPGIGPRWLNDDETHIGVRSAFVSEAGEFAPVLVPEVGLFIEPWAFYAAFGVPIRFDLDDGPTLGRTDSVGDATRFLRTLRVGQPGADFELGLERQRAYTFGNGVLLRRFAPSLGFDGIPGLAVDRSPLALYGGLRTRVVEIQLLVDDVVQPDVVGGRLGFQLSRRALLAGTYIFEDDSSAHLTGIETELRVVDGAAWNVGLGAEGALRFDDDEASGSFVARGRVRHRFGSRLDTSVGLEAFAGVGTGGFVFDPVSPVQPVAREALADAAQLVGSRGLAGAALNLEVQWLQFDVRYAQGIDDASVGEDRVVEAVFELDRLPLNRRRSLGLRAGVSARRPFNDPLYVAWGAADLHLSSWLTVSAHALRSDAWEGGAGLRVYWSP